MIMEKYIKQEECQHRAVYILHSRNLKFGVYNKHTNGFIGIRTKFGSRFLFTEYHWDNESFATAKPIEIICEVPETIEIIEELGTECFKCKTKVEFVRDPSLDGSVIYTGKWKHLGAVNCDSVDPISIHNDELFELLDMLNN
jgi:hypothetical protein